MADSFNLPYQDSNPSGIGNTQYGNAVDLLALQKDNNAANTAAVDEVVKTRANKAKENASFLAGLHPDYDGIMPEDTPYFQKESQKLLDLGAKAVGTGKQLNDPANPYYWQIQEQQNKILAATEMSKGQNKELVTYSKDWLTQPEKYDESTKANVSSWRTSANPFIRDLHGDASGLFKISPPSVFAELDKRIEKLKPQEELVGDKKLATGRYGTEYNKGVRPEQATAIGEELYHNPSYQKDLPNIWKSLSPSQQAAYNMDAAIETQQNQAKGINSTGDPLKYMIVDVAKKRAGGLQKELKNVSFDPAVYAGAKYALEHPSDDDSWQKRYGLSTGDKRFYDTEIPNIQTGLTTSAQPGTTNIPTLGGNITVKPSEPDMYSNYDAGTPIGFYSIDVPKVKDGAIVTDEDGKTVMTKIMGIPNSIIDHRTFNGVPYIRTEESMQNYAVKKGKQVSDLSPTELLNDKEAWVPETAQTPRQILNAKTGKEREDFIKQHNDFLNRKSAVDENGNINAKKAAGIQEITKPATTYTIKGKKYTLKQLTDLGYTESQVEQYKAK